jgi:hypothetical protein
MKRIRIVGLCLMAAFAIGAVASSTASAVTVIKPEVGRCVKAAVPAEGLYTSAACTLQQKPKKTGAYEWLPGPGPNAGLSGTAGASTLESAAGKISCKHQTIAGVVLNEYNEHVNAVTFTGCESKAAKVKCETSKANGNNTAGTILDLPAEGTLGLIKAPTKAGIDLQGVVPPGKELEEAGFTTNLLAFYECGAKTQGDGTGAQELAEGGLEGEITATNKMTTKVTLKFLKSALATATKANQKPEEFVAPSQATTANQHITSWSFAGGPPSVLPANQTNTDAILYEEAIELRTENTPG